MKNTFMFVLRDEKHNKQRGIWTLDTHLKPGELMAKCAYLYPRFSSRWTLYVLQTKCTSPTASHGTILSLMKTILGVLKANSDNNQSLILQPHNPWDKDAQHRKKLEQ